MAVKVVAELSVCETCLLMLANSDGPDGHAVKMVEHYGDDVLKVVAAGDELGFCQSPCDTCGEELHGDRFVAVEMSE